MWTTPAGARPSGSSMTIAKLFVPSGAPDQASGGEIFSPTQFGLRCLSAQAFLTANWSLSFKAEEVSTSTSARAAPNDRAKAPANNKLPRAYFMMSSLSVRYPLARPRGIGPRHRSHEGRYCVTPFKSTTNSRDVPRYPAVSRPDTAYDWADGDIRLRRISRVAAPSNDGPLTDHIADLPARWAVAAAHAPKLPLRWAGCGRPQCRDPHL